jgi:hypothetical protein
MATHPDRAVVKRLVIALIVVFGQTASFVVASNDVPHEEKGYQSSGYTLSDYETINLANGNLTFRVPLHTLRTDGGLEYPVTAYFNSKFWATRRYCTLSHPEVSCGENGGYIRKAVIANGIEAYGFGWDIRPPRIQEPTPASVRQARAFVDASGALHFMSGTKAWAPDKGKTAVGLDGLGS